MSNRSYHIWYYGAQYPDAVPFTSAQAAGAELKRQLDEANRQGDYPAAQVVSIGKGNHKDVRIVKGW